MIFSLDPRKHKPCMSLKEPKIVDLDFMQLEMYPRYVISTINEGVTIGIPELEKLFSIFREQYGYTSFVSIANRKFDYTIDPTCYMKTDANINILGIAVLAKSQQTAEIAAFERKFYNGSFKIFSEMQDCISWAELLLAKDAKN